MRAIIALSILVGSLLLAAIWPAFGGFLVIALVVLGLFAFGAGVVNAVTGGSAATAFILGVLVGWVLGDE